MKILACSHGGYMQEDFETAMRKMNIEYKEVGYTFINVSQDVYFERNFPSIIIKEQCDLVFSFNYHPVLSKVCQKENIPYVAWAYDCPMNVAKPEETLGNSMNHVFFFDFDEYAKYKKMGFDTVYHMPLAVDTDRLSNISCKQDEVKKYSCDISFVGSLYGSEYPQLYAGLGDYERGFLDALVDTQLNLYGCYLLPETLKDETVLEWKKYFSKVEKIANETDRTFCNWVRQVTGSEITRRERLYLLSLLSKRRNVKLYSYGTEDMLNQVEFCGTVETRNEMPKVFKNSKINLNISLKTITSGVPLRVFDILGSGGFLLTNWQKEIAEYFVDGEEVVMYESIEDAIRKAEYYLENEEERKRIAANGFRAIQRFSFQNQIRQILDIVNID